MNDYTKRKEALSDYISRQEAIDICMSYCPDDDGTSSKSGEDLRNMLDEIENVPAADVVEVVMCKDCKCWQDQEEGIVEVPICTKEDCSIIIMGENDFCSKGERKDS